MLIRDRTAFTGWREPKTLAETVYDLVISMQTNTPEYQAIKRMCEDFWGPGYIDALVQQERERRQKTG